MSKILYLNDHNRPNDSHKFLTADDSRITSKVEFFNDNGELIWEPLHNKTVIAGSALTAMKLFNLNRSVLNNTPSYDTEMELENGNDGSAYPVATADIQSTENGNLSTIPTTINDETQRKIIGFCVGQGGAGIDISDVFNVRYCDRISPDNLVPFRYPLVSKDDVDENIYKGKKMISFEDGKNRNAYYFKTFSNTPNLVQNYVSSIGTFADTVNPGNVYANTANADKAQSYVELHLKITSEDCREYFIAHKGLENAKINQISLISAWEKNIEVTKNNISGNNVTQTVTYFQDIRPFSVINIPNEILSERSKSISILYTLYF